MIVAFYFFKLNFFPKLYFYRHDVEKTGKHNIHRQQFNYCLSSYQMMWEKSARKLRDFDAVACSEYGISNLFNHRRVVKCWHLIYMWLGNCVICKGYYHAIALRRVITSTINMILSFFSLKTRGNIDLLVTHCTLVNEYPLHLNYAVWIL